MDEKRFSRAGDETNNYQTDRDSAVVLKTKLHLAVFDGAHKLLVQVDQALEIVASLYWVVPILAACCSVYLLADPNEAKKGVILFIILGAIVAFIDLQLWIWAPMGRTLSGNPGSAATFTTVFNTVAGASFVLSYYAFSRKWDWLEFKTLWASLFVTASATSLLLFWPK